MAPTKGRVNGSRISKKEQISSNSSKDEVGSNSGSQDSVDKEVTRMAEKMLRSVSRRKSSVAMMT